MLPFAGLRTVRGPSQAAVDLVLRTLDLQLRYRDPGEVNKDRVSLWCDQLVLDARAHDAAASAATSSRSTTCVTACRRSLSAATLSVYNHEIGILQEVALDHDLSRTTTAAHRLQAALRG